MNKRLVWITCVGVAVIFCTAWGTRKPAPYAPPLTAGKRVVKNLVKFGDPEGTIEVGRRLLAELQSNNYDWNALWERDDIMHVPDQEFYQHAPPPEMRARHYTWSPCPQLEYQDEVAFYSNIYTWEDFTVIPGIEGRLHISGFYIVAWKDGRVERVPVEDTRLYPVAKDRLITVFPGMSEYRADLPKRGSTDISERVAAFYARRAMAARK
ncbi:MAG: hypothetical protein ABL962_19200 [Fimbriimonadaceae bacterium]